jgi:uncharacterized protein with FMN-binding domain
MMKKLKPSQLIPAAAAATLTAVPMFTMAHMLTSAAHGTSFASTASNTAGPTPTAQPTPVPTTATVRKSAPAATNKRKVTQKHYSPPKSKHQKSVTARTYWGTAVADQYGTVQAEVRVRGKKITAVWVTSPMNDPHSMQINQAAVPILRSETLQAQSASISTVAGATETSYAYLQSLQSALSKAGI